MELTGFAAEWLWDIKESRVTPPRFLAKSEEGGTS